MQSNGRVKVWNTSSWTVEGELIVANSHLLGAAFAPDSKTVIIGDKNGVLHDWSLATKAEIRTLRASEGAGNFSNVAFSPDGKTLVAFFESAKPITVMIWNTTDWIAQTESGYISAAFSKDGKLLALGGRSVVKLIDPDSRKQIRDIELPEMRRGEARSEPKTKTRSRKRKYCASS
jgi:WD40 repeat protein